MFCNARLLNCALSARLQKVYLIPELRRSCDRAGGVVIVAVIVIAQEI